jgi:hypothetical protein
VVHLRRSIPSVLLEPPRLLLSLSVCVPVPVSMSSFESISSSSSSDGYTTSTIKYRWGTTNPVKIGDFELSSYKYNRMCYNETTAVTSSGTLSLFPLVISSRRLLPTVGLLSVRAGYQCLSTYRSPSLVPHRRGESSPSLMFTSRCLGSPSGSPANPPQLEVPLSHSL